MFFSVPKNNFEITAKLAKKITNKNLGKILWPDSLDSQNITYFLLFDAISQTDLLFTQTLDGAVKKIKMPFPGIYELKKNFKASLNTPKSQFNPLIIPFTQRKPAQKKIFEVIRFLRDPKKVKKLKELYHNKCQICGYTLEYDKGKFYSEVHHYNPLKASAADEEDNMIVVCPNHHAEFDHNMIAIDHDGTTIIDRGGKKIAAIRFKNEHSLDVKNIESQLEGS